MRLKLGQCTLAKHLYERVLLMQLTDAQIEVAARKLGEARVEAEALLDGLQAAMTADGDLLSADETAALQSDMKDLETVMAANQPDDIRDATEVLGKASEIFAARRMDRSIQKALQGVSLSELESDVAEESTPCQKSLYYPITRSAPMGRW